MGLVRSARMVAAATCLILAGVVQATATDVVIPPRIVEPVPIAQDEWKLSLTPYGWLMFMDMDITARGRTVGVQTNIFEILDKSDSILAWMAYAEARKGPTAIYLDTIWADLGFSADLVAQRNPVANLAISASADVGLNQEMAIIEGGVSHEIARWSEPAIATKDYIGGGSYTSLNAILGARYWYMGTEVNFAGTASFEALGLTRTGPFSGTASGEIDWVDPVIGLSLHHQLAPGKQIRVRGDIGGFGVGSDFSWQAAAVYSWDAGDFLGHDWHGAVGYRALSVDYSAGSGTGSGGIDLLIHGPIIGAGIKF